MGPRCSKIIQSLYSNITCLMKDYIFILFIKNCLLLVKKCTTYLMCVIRKFQRFIEYEISLHFHKHLPLEPVLSYLFSHSRTLLRFILILYSYLCLGPQVVFPMRFQAKLLMNFLSSPWTLHSPPNQYSLFWSLWQYWVKLQIVNLFMQFSTASSHFFVLGPYNTFHWAPSAQTVQV
jgi:hypothetical protein